MKFSPLVLAVVCVQVLSAIFFVSEIMLSVLGIPTPPIPWQTHELIEIGAAIGLISGVIMGWIVLRSSRRRMAAAENVARAASGAFMELVEERFVEWKLTPAERDVAMFALKGLSLSEIAALRQTSEGTVKAQSNAIYRKAGVTGRTQLLSLFVDDLMQEDGITASS